MIDWAITSLQRNGIIFMPITYVQWKNKSEYFFNFTSRDRWDNNFISEANQMKEIIDDLKQKMHCLKTSSSDTDWALAEDANNETNRRKLLDSFNEWGLFKNNGEYSEALTLIIGLNGRVVVSFQKLFGECCRLSREIGEMIDAVNTIKEYISSALSYLSKVEKEVESEYAKTNDYMDLTRNIDKFINWWNNNPYNGDSLSVGFESLKRFDLYRKGLK